MNLLRRRQLQFLHQNLAESALLRPTQKRNLTRGLYWQPPGWWPSTRLLVPRTIQEMGGGLLLLGRVWKKEMRRELEAVLQLGVDLQCHKQGRRVMANWRPCDDWMLVTSSIAPPTPSKTWNFFETRGRSVAVDLDLFFRIRSTLPPPPFCNSGEKS